MYVVVYCLGGIISFGVGVVGNEEDVNYGWVSVGGGEDDE